MPSDFKQLRMGVSMRKVQSKVQLCKWRCGVVGTTAARDKRLEPERRASVPWKMHINIQRKYRITVVIASGRSPFPRSFVCVCVCVYVCVCVVYVMSAQERVCGSWEGSHKCVRRVRLR